ncbi:lipopolysaccharide assembly protein LapB [Pleionea sp. CnH1-48]|uniref:lipopolysaccharide assembly protein LapB n=1 Tax=Pleionea sp. CnH1-48 TaxID=2954494 RepID=UPI002098420A|nr:lipopolysaccharide assembly protein LapB [Pleionea sp. CnH1-48]MCO7223821.1 lipopolysaccharide assembly protein LapB [Pleionea sp. CnH1-48]
MWAESLYYALVFLLPVAAYSGYRVGKRNQSKSDQENYSGLSRRYFVGLKHILNEEPDKAIDTFTRMLEVNSETIEIHLTLGNLRRKRGEVDTAIRLHQNLIARPSLPASARKIALLELGHDYMSAGLFDRAESIFKELSLESEHKAASLGQLMRIYQQTRDWDKAVTVAEQLQSVDGESHAAEIAGFYCELAESMRDKGQTKQAYQVLKKAVAIDTDCVRANIIRGRLAQSEGQYKQAIKFYKDILRQNAGFISEVMPELEQCYRALDDKKGYYQFLNQSLDRGAGVSVVLALAEHLLLEQGDEKATQFIVAHLHEKPSLKGLHKLIDIHLKKAEHGARPSLEMLRNIVSKLIEIKPVYRCEHCGFSGKSLFWQCPSCKCWGSVKPIIGLEGE